jgi:predicted transcriptional regulator
MSLLPQRQPARDTAAKISVTVDPAVLRDVKAAARRSGRTLSAHISQALARDLRRQKLAELIAEHEAAHGVITERELAEARAAWRD